MPALTAILDAHLRQVSEPGFRRSINARTLGSQGAAAADGTSPSSLWRPPLAQTTMLRPLQLNADWLNSTNALPWIVRLVDFDMAAADLANGYIFEGAAHGNTASPWVYHIATVPDGFFPAAPAPHGFPTSGPSLLGVDPGIGASEPSLLNAEIRPTAGYALPSVVPPKGSEPAPLKTVDATTARIIGVSKAPLLANQPLYLRWVQSASNLGFPPVYRFYIGQFCLIVKENFLQILVDTSLHGDRSSFSHVGTFPLWTIGSDDNDDQGSPGSIWPAWMAPFDVATHDRSLLWIPMRRNQVLLVAGPGGKAKLFQVQPGVQRLPDDSDWDIVRSDKLIVWVLSPIWGRFQVQRVAYASGGQKAQAEPLVLDYTPASPPAQTLFADQDHGTSITIAQTSPPSYSLPVNSAVECGTLPTGISSYQARQYGYELTFNAGIGGAWTPFFYNLLIHKEPVFVNATAPPLTVTDTTAGSPGANQSTLVEVRCSAGRKPGEGRAEVNLWDYSSYPLDSYSLREGYPVQIKNGATPVFTGYAMTPGAMPVKASGPRRMTIACADRWHLLTRTYLRDNGNWSGTGHIDVVQNILQQAGVDITGMDTPPKTAQYNQPLGSVERESNANELENDYLSPWRPKPAENAATFLRRISEHFSGWDIGFDVSGVPFYLPKYYYTASELSIYETAAAATADGHTGSPLYKEVSFSVVPPEANVILVKATGRNQAGPFFSSLFVDWQSFLNPSAVNYLGFRKPEVVEIAGMYSCRGINWAARTIFQATRRRHVIRRVEMPWNAAVKVGHCLTIHPYGLHRTISFSSRFHKSGHQRMEIEGELVERGW